MRDYLQIYNKAYEKITPDWLNNEKKVDLFLERNAATLIDFYETYSRQFNYPEKDYSKLRVLDLGCGLGGLSFYFAAKRAQVTGIDVSNLAITAARQISAAKGVKADFIQADVANSGLELRKFDLIFDSHLFHCLVEEKDRENYFKFVKRHMAQGSLFLLETMVFQKQFRTPVGYSLDQDFVLWKEVEEEELPIRRITPPIELETQVQNAGLNIHYLYFHAELSFEVFDEYNGYPHQNLPQTARLAAKLGPNSL